MRKKRMSKILRNANTHIQWFKQYGWVLALFFGVFTIYKSINS